jgi:hypothetical protein
MTARLTILTLAAFVALGAAASAQTASPSPSPNTGAAPASGGAKTPQSAPNPGAAEANPSTVRGPGGSTTEPAPMSGSAPATYGGDPATSGNDFTASPKLGPQNDLGKRINRTVHYIAGDYIAPPLVYNAYAGPSKGNNDRSRAYRAAFEVPLGQYAVYAGGESRTYQYQTRAGSVRGIGVQGTGFVPSFTAREYDEDVRAGIKVTGPRIYGAVSYLRRGSNFEPTERGLGYGIEKLADVDQNFSLHGNIFFYPNISGRYSVGGAGNYGVSYRAVRYLIGASIQPNHSPVFLDAGFLGDRSHPRTDAPIGYNHQGPYVGLGIHF